MQALLMGSVACKTMKNIYHNIITEYLNQSSDISYHTKFLPHNKTVVHKYEFHCIIITAMEHLQIKFEKP